MIGDFRGIMLSLSPDYKICIIEEGIMKAKMILAACLLFLSVWQALGAQTVYPKREFRGAWIQCVNGQFQGMPPRQMQVVLVSQLDKLQKAGINAIIFQVRAECDALYKSSYEPGPFAIHDRRVPQAGHGASCVD